MTRAKTAAVPAAEDLRAVKAAAVQRVLERRRAPKYATYLDPRTGGTIKIMLDPGGELLEPETIGEWVDMRTARTPLSGLGDVLIRMWEGVRAGPDAVPAAVGLALALSGFEQFGLWMALNSVPAGPGGIGQLLVREWKRRGLRVEPAPIAPALDPFTNWDTASPEARRVQYRSPLGNPG
jgi:hypothetical protein